MAESDALDFKREYSPEKKAAFWAETVKDIVAFANTKGGVIVFGVDDTGVPSGMDCSDLFNLDQASLVDQIRKYTDVNHSGLSVVKVARGNEFYPCILIQSANVPLVFTKVGTYETEPGKQKTAFSVGTIYVRHGSKSEVCTRADIQFWIERELSRVRHQWLGNIRKVVEAEPGSTVVVLNASSSPTAGNVRLTNDPTAPIVRLQKLSDQYPFRQSDVLASVNKRIPEETKINSHDIHVIKHFLQISPESTPHLVHKPHDKASPQYSIDFIDTVLSEFDRDPNFFEKCRENWKTDRYGTL